MQHPIENGAGDDLVAEGFAPVRVGLVGGHDHGPSLVPAGDELEEEIGSQAVDGDVADLVNNQ